MKTAYANPGTFPLSTESRYSVKTILMGGAISGVDSGIAMAMIGMITTYFIGMGFWLPVKLMVAMPEVKMR